MVTVRTNVSKTIGMQANLILTNRARSGGAKWCLRERLRGKGALELCKLSGPLAPSKNPPSHEAHDIDMRSSWKVLFLGHMSG